MTGHALSRRNFLAGAGALGAATALSRPAIAQKQELVVATFGGRFEDLLRQHVIPEFEKKHSATVKLELGFGAVFIPKVIASRGKAPYDVVYLNEDEAYLGQGLNLWAPDQIGKLANAADIYDAVKPPHLPLYGSVIYEFPLVYNPNKMAKPESWGDLWTAKGVTTGVPHLSSLYGICFLLTAAELNGGGADNMAPGFDALKRLPAMKIYKGVTQGDTMIRQGEIDAALFYDQRAILLKDEGLPIDWARPKEGLWGQRTGCQIPASAAQQELALAWVDMTLSPEYQKVFTSELYSPTNRKVQVDERTAARLILGEERVAAMKFAPWDVINPQRDDLMARWTREFAG